MRIADDVLLYLCEPLEWIPCVWINDTVIDSDEQDTIWHGLNLYGPTVINQAGGEQLYQICRGWSAILSQGPEPLVLTKSWIMPADTDEWKPYRFKTSRARLVAQLDQLAEFGQQVASGDYFLLHLGI